MLMNDSPLNLLPQSEWDAFIASIIRPFLSYAHKDPLISYQDLEQEAWVGLLSASKNYDSSKSKFTTYAYHYIRGRILRYVLEKTRVSDNRLNVTDPSVLEPSMTDESVDSDELMNSILSCVSTEPNAHFLIERFVKGKSFRTIAKENGLSHQGVALHVKRLIALAEKRLKHENA